MKLSDISTLVAWQTVFNSKTEQLQACLDRKGLSVKYGEIYIKDTAVLKKVQDLLLIEAKREYDEAKTKMMMLGVTEFPPVPTAK